MNTLSYKTVSANKATADKQWIVVDAEGHNLGRLASKVAMLLRGKYKSSGGDGIPIGAFNVPQGSVVVTAAGRVLVEGVDYSVNYQLGRVQILDPSLQASNTPIEVSLENNSIFAECQKKSNRRLLPMERRQNIYIRIFLDY